MTGIEEKMFNLVKTYKKECEITQCINCKIRGFCEVLNELETALYDSGLYIETIREIVRERDINGLDTEVCPMCGKRTLVDTPVIEGESWYCLYCDYVTENLIKEIKSNG